MTSFFRSIIYHLLDVEKTFDKVWWDGLIYKLYNNFTLPLLVNKLLAKSSSPYIQHNSQKPPFSSNARVPQNFHALYK